MKVSELTGVQLDYWVAKAEGLVPDNFSLQVMDGMFSKYNSDWAHGGPIIERERLLVAPAADGGWGAWPSKGGGSHYAHHEGGGPTPLIAAMRAYVASKYGAEVPDIV